jgi:hypothetical protein
MNENRKHRYSVAPTSTITPTPTMTIENLRAIIYASNPESPQYEPKSTAYAEFPEAVQPLISSHAVRNLNI